MAKKKAKAKPASPSPDEAEGSAKPKGGFIAKLGLCVALGLTSFGTVYMLPKSETGHAAPAAAEAGSSHAATDFTPDSNTHYLELNDFTITLQDNSRILKIGITLEVTAGEEKYIDSGDPKLRDAFTGYLRALRLDQVEDAAYMAQMRAQLLRRAQLILGKDTVHGILITDFLLR